MDGMGPPGHKSLTRDFPAAKKQQVLAMRSFKSQCRMFLWSQDSNIMINTSTEMGCDQVDRSQIDLENSYSHTFV